MRSGRFLLNGRATRRASQTQIRAWADEFHPDPGPWPEYYRRRKHYFFENLARYRQAKAFWAACPEVHRAFIRCARFSNRRPGSHPDYIVVFRRGGRRAWSSFVEVKSPRGSLRPSQRRFFPELVRDASQNVMLVRIGENGANPRFYRFAPNGSLLPLSNPILGGDGASPSS